MNRCQTLQHLSVLPVLAEVINSVCWEINKRNCHLLFFFSKLTFLKNSIRNTIRVANSLDPDQAQHFVQSVLGPKSSQMLSAEDNGR